MYIIANENNIILKILFIWSDFLLDYTSNFLLYSKGVIRYMYVFCLTKNFVREMSFMLHAPHWFSIIIVLRMFLNVFKY